MGNETSVPSEADDDSHRNFRTHSHHHSYAGKHLIDSDDDEVSDHDHLNVSFRKRGASGSLRGSVIAAAATNGSSSGFVDPVLSAAAAGAVARKTTHRKRTHSNPFRQHANESSNNEWKKSLQRLAKTAASTASNVAHATAPVLADAGSIVVESAKEFATDVQDEFAKPKYPDIRDGAESVIMFPYSPGRSWYAPYSPSSAYDTDLSPTTPNTGQSDSVGRVRIDLQVTRHAPLASSGMKKKQTSGHKEEDVSTQQSRRSVEITHFPALDKLHKKEVSQRDEYTALPETIAKNEDASTVEVSKVSRNIGDRNGGVSISDSPEASAEFHSQTTRPVNESPEIENDNDASTSKSEKVLDKEPEELGEIYFTVLPRTAEEALTGNLSTGTSGSEETIIPDESAENECVGNGEQSSKNGTKLDEGQPASLSLQTKGGSGVGENSDEKKLIDQVDASNDVQENEALNERNSSELSRTSDIKDLDIFDEFQQLVESAAKEGVFFSLDNEDSLAVLDFDVGNAEIERELEEAESSSPLEKELEDALKPLELVLEEVSKPLEENQGRRTNSSILTSSESNGNDEEGVFEISADEHDNDDDFPHIVHEVSTDSDMAIGETKSIHEEDTSGMLASKYAAEQELRDLLQRVENGEVVDEDRLYELELFERYQSGEKLTADEMEDLESLLKRRQNLNDSSFAMVGEKTGCDETSARPSSFDADASNDNKIADKYIGHDDHEISNQDDENDGNRISTERQEQPTYDETNDACESTRTNETPKSTTATQSEIENPWLYWSVGQKGSDSSPLSTARLASILSISDPGTIQIGEGTGREGSYINRNRSPANEGWRYWADVDGDIGIHHQIVLQEASLLPQNSIVSPGEKNEAIAKISTPGNNAEWVYWSVVAWPQVGLTERAVHTGITSVHLEPPSDFAVPGVGTTNAGGGATCNSESGWLYWARLGTAQPTAREFSDSNNTQPEKYHAEEKLIVGVKSDGDLFLARQRSEEEASFEQDNPLLPPGQSNDDLSKVQQGQEETRLGRSDVFRTGEAAQSPGQSNFDSAPSVHLGGSRSVVVNREATGWMFWSISDEGLRQNDLGENKQSWDMNNNTAQQEVQLETDRAEVPFEQTDKPAWLHWAQPDDAKSSVSVPPVRESIQRSAPQQVESPPTTIPVQASHHSGWMYWSALGEGNIQGEVVGTSGFENVDSSTPVHLDKIAGNLKFEDNDEPGWLHWAILEQPEARDPKQVEDGSMMRESRGLLPESRPSGSDVPATGSHAWLYWSTLGKVQTDSGSKNISLTSDLLQPSTVPEVYLNLPNGIVCGDQEGKPASLQWAQYGELKPAIPKLPQHEDPISNPEEVSGWLYWSTMGEVRFRNDDRSVSPFDCQHSSALEEVHFRPDIIEESIEHTVRADWLYWAQIDQVGVSAPRLLDQQASLQTEGKPSEEQESQTTQRTEEDFKLPALVEGAAKAMTRGRMKTRGQATKEDNADEPTIVANTRVARELNTSYNPVVLKNEENHREDENITILKRDRSGSDTASNEERGRSRSSKNDLLTAVPRTSDDSEVNRTQKDGVKISEPDVRMVEAASDITSGDEDCSSQIKTSDNAANKMNENVSAPSSVKTVVGIFTKLSAESRQAMKVWNGINQGKRLETQSGPESVGSRGKKDILQDAKRLAKVASDLAEEALQARSFGVFSKANESFEQADSSRRNRKGSERHTDVEIGTSFQIVQPSTEFAVDLYNNSKEALGVAVSKFAVDLSINDKQKQSSIAIPDSIFKYDKGATTSLSTVASVPLEDCNSDLNEESPENDIAVSWELTPTKREANVDHNLLQSPIDDSLAILSSIEGEVSQHTQQTEAGTTKKEHCKSSNKSSAESEVLSPMLSPKARRAKRPSRTLMKLHSNEFEDWTSRLEVELESADSSVAGGPSSPNGPKGFDQMNDPESLGLALVSFSSIDSVDFLKKIPHGQKEGHSSLFWRVLTANWKHSQIWKSMFEQSPSLDDSWLEKARAPEEDTYSANSSATIRFQVRNKQVHLFSSGCNQLRSQYFLSHRSSTPGLLAYLCDIGPTHLAPEDNNAESVLRHAVGQTDAASLDVNSLLKHAESHQQSFAELLRDIVAFASLESNSSEIKHSSGLKHYTAIRMKADRKYGGDILQVKDVLRGQITFPNETSLISGLLCLHQTCKNVEGKEIPSFTIVRLKNYFRKIDGSVSSLTEMPTGYRHILINIQIAGTLVAELQFQLAQLFDILGPDGYLLHAEISSPLGDNGGSKRESSISGFTVGSACEIAKKILCFDHMKNSEQASTELQQPKSQFAHKKSDKVTSAVATTKTLEENSPPTELERKEAKSIAGIGAAAAAAARSAMMKKFKVSSKGGSISEISDAVAEERNGKDLTSGEKREEREPVGGIEAAAAARRSKMKNLKASSKGGGIAALAAAASRERNGIDKFNAKNHAEKDTVGGIGAAAAAVARRSMTKDLKMTSKGGSIGEIADVVVEERNGGDRPIYTKMHEEREPIGGIGAVTAAAARRSKMETFKANSKGGGIAAIAAAVAEERNGGNSTAKTKQVGQGRIGGIGAAAAAVARNGRQKNPKPNVDGGSIAAIAAAAANTRKSKDPNQQNGKKAAKANPSISLENGNSSQAHKIDPLKTKTLNTQTRETDLITEAINVGIEEASSNPRNLPAFYCLYLLLRRLEEIDQEYFSKQGDGSSAPRVTMEEIKTMLLTRCLAISNQASSIGMFGWLEYGSSNVVERSLGLPIELMQRLALNFASSGNWNKASDILSSCVIRCKEYLSLHHPTTLCTMIDLAITFARSSRELKASSLVQTVSDVVGEFLAESEALVFADIKKRFAFERSPEQVFILERKTSALSVLHTYATDFKSLLSRDFLGLVDPTNHITLLNHSLVANCFAVLASCNAVCVGGSSTRDEGSGRTHRFWTFAYLHYQYSLRGWTQIHNLSHPYAASAAFSVARCLRELGKIDESISFLESLVECLQDSPAHEEFGDSDLGIEPRVPESFSFLPPKSGQVNESTRIFSSTCRREQTIVLCLWTLAVYVVQRKPDEQGRVRALKLLHQASDILRNLLYHADNMHENTRMVCLELYTCVENEARVLFEPLRQVPMQPPEIKERLRMGYQSSLTSMRRKRWFQQQQMTESASSLSHPFQQFI